MAPGFAGTSNVTRPCFKNGQVMTFCFDHAAVPAKIERARAAVNVTDPPTILEKIRLMCELPMTPSDQIMRLKNPQSSGGDFSHSAAREICAKEVGWAESDLGISCGNFRMPRSTIS